MCDTWGCVDKNGRLCGSDTVQSLEVVDQVSVGLEELNVSSIAILRETSESQQLS